MTHIHTTHTGSIARPPGLAALLKGAAEGKPLDERTFEAECVAAVEEVVRQEWGIGLDIINDGDRPKTGFAQYVTNRLEGFDSSSIELRGASLEDREFFDADDSQPTR